MSDRMAVFLHGEELEQYHYPAACPFDTSRAMRTLQAVYGMGLMKGPHRRMADPVRASREEMEMFHLPAYLDALGRASSGMLDELGIEMGLGTPDCPAFDGMLDYASWACGATITGMRMLLNGEADVAFNPSGGYHHAHRGHAAGFCYVNDVVLACMVARQAGRKVLFIDVDVHHCDGVQEAFYESADVMTLSLHESGRTLFPGSGFEEEAGVGAGYGYSVNVPLPVGTYDEAYERAFHAVALPLAHAFPADVIVLELGMDALAGDPLAHLHLTNNVHAHIVSELMGLHKPLLVTGGGGYHIENTVRGWALAWSVMCGEDTTHDPTIGLGGVMLQNMDWLGGLRDRVLISNGGRRDMIDADIEATVERIRRTIFPVHGI